MGVYYSEALSTVLKIEKAEETYCSTEKSRSEPRNTGMGKNEILGISKEGTEACRQRMNQQ